MSEELMQKLRATTAHLGLTQKELSKKLGVPFPTVLHWFNNQSTPRGLALVALNNALDALLKQKKKK